MFHDDVRSHRKMNRTLLSGSCNLLVPTTGLLFALGREGVLWRKGLFGKQSDSSFSVMSHFTRELHNLLSLFFSVCHSFSLFLFLPVLQLAYTHTSDQVQEHRSKITAYWIRKLFFLHPEFIHLFFSYFFLDLGPFFSFCVSSVRGDGGICRCLCVGVWVCPQVFGSVTGKSVSEVHFF